MVCVCFFLFFFNREDFTTMVWHEEPIGLEETRGDIPAICITQFSTQKDGLMDEEGE
jgi:hypothetical protein